MEDREDREDTLGGAPNPHSGVSVDKPVDKPVTGPAPNGRSRHTPSTDGYAWNDPRKWDPNIVKPWCRCWMCEQRRGKPFAFEDRDR